MVRYVGFDERDKTALLAFYPVARPYFGDIVDRFYERLQAHDAARAVFATPKQVDRLKISLSAWLHRLLSGPWDEDYFELRSRIGRMHVKVGLAQRYMFTAMSVIRVQLMDIAEKLDITGSARPLATSRALARIIDLELAIMLESYREDREAAVRRLECVEKDLLQRRLQISEARYQAVVENAEVMVIAMDEDDTAILFNRQAERISGYFRNEIIGHSCIELLCYPEDRALMRTTLSAVFNGERVPAVEARVSTMTNDVRWIRWQLAPLDTIGRRAVCAFGIDITQERQFAQSTQRSARLAALGTLAAGLAHEIRNPLNAAQLQLMLVERRIGRDTSEQSSKAHNSVALVREELKRLAVLVEDFLAFARPAKLRLESHDLSLLINSVVELLKVDAKQVGVRLSPNCPDVLAARFDKQRLTQVLLNLIRNGMHAAGEGGEVSVAARRLGASIQIDVVDSGGNLPVDIDIFEPFSTTKEGGTGLGLAIVHRIVSEHDGEIRAEPVDEVTRFRIILPVDGPAAAL